LARTATHPKLNVFSSPPKFFDDIDPSDPALTDDAEVPWLLFQNTPSSPDTPQATTVTLSQPQRKTKKKEKKKYRKLLANAE
jgi:hypothetical protein